jgi:hypothetical protein
MAVMVGKAATTETRDQEAAVIHTDQPREGEDFMHPLSIKVMTWSLGLYTAVTYVLCVLYGLIAPKGLHATQLLEWMLPGFTWLSPGSFVLGLVEAFLFGVYAGLVFTPIYNLVQRRCH